MLLLFNTASLKNMIYENIMQGCEYMQALRLVYIMTQSFAFPCIISMCCIVNMISPFNILRTNIMMIGCDSMCCIWPVSFQTFITTQQMQCLQNVNPALHSNNLGITEHTKDVLMHCLYYRSIEFKETMPCTASHTIK